MDGTQPVEQHFQIINTSLYDLEYKVKGFGAMISIYMYRKLTVLVVTVICVQHNAIAPPIDTP